MKPYYQEDGITIYHGDCREILPTLPKVDLLLADPPYGIDLHRGWLGKDASRIGIVGDDTAFDPSPLLGFAPAIIWGANNFSNMLPPGGWLCWDKRCSTQADKMYGSSFELAWCSDRHKFRMIRILHGGVVNADGPNIHRSHPTQKPRALMRWCLGLFPHAELVLDPYMGSGTTLDAAKLEGRQAIGIEIEERYCEIAAKRLAQGVLELSA